MSLRVINPEEIGAPKGFSHGMLAPAAGRIQLQPVAQCQGRRRGLRKRLEMPGESALADRPVGQRAAMLFGRYEQQVRARVVVETDARTENARGARIVTEQREGAAVNGGPSLFERAVRREAVAGRTRGIDLDQCRSVVAQGL